MVTVDDVRAVLARLPRSSEVLVRDRGGSGRSPGPCTQSVPEWSSPSSPSGRRQSSNYRLQVVEEADRGTSVRATPRNGAGSTDGRERVVETLRDR